MSEPGGTTRISSAVLILALIAFCGSLILSEVLFVRTPFINDEFGYIFQAKLFLAGKLYAPSPCLREAFDFPHMINNGKWYSQYPPGFPMLLAPFVFLNIPWLLNPLLAAFSVMVIYFLGLELSEKRTAILSALLCSLSLWFLVNSATFMSHTANLLFFSIFLLFVIRSIKSPTFSSGILAGLSLGLAFLIRPYETAWASLPVLIYYLYEFLKSPRKHLKNGLAMFLSAGFLSFLFLAYNFLTNGHPLVTGYEVRYGPEHGLGFGKKGYTTTPHTPFRGLLLLGENFRAINAYLFGWPLSSLFPLLFIFFPKNQNFRKNDRIIIFLYFLTILSLSLGLFIYWGSYAMLGSRQFFTIMPCLVILCAYGLIRIEELLPRKITLIVKRARLDKKVLTSLALILLFSYSFFYTLRLEQVNKGRGNLIPYTAHVYRPHLLINTLKKINLGRALVILQMLSTNHREFPDGGWEAGFIQNDPWLRNPTIFARKLNIPFEKFFDCFPHRKIFLYWGTNRRGFLTEIKNLNGQPVFGQPITFKPDRPDKFAELVSSPEEVFLIYGQDFKVFIQGLLEQTSFERIDAAWLKNQAMACYRAHDFQKAAQFLEAALQVEVNYEARYQMLSMLAGLYRGLDLDSLSERVLRRVNTRRVADAYGVVPERGF